MHITNLNKNPRFHCKEEGAGCTILDLRANLKRICLRFNDTKTTYSAHNIIKLETSNKKAIKKHPDTFRNFPE